MPAPSLSMRDRRVYPCSCRSHAPESWQRVAPARGSLPLGRARATRPTQFQCLSLTLPNVFDMASSSSAHFSSISLAAKRSSDLKVS